MRDDDKEEEKKRDEKTSDAADKGKGNKMLMKELMHKADMCQKNSRERTLERR